MMCGLRMQKLVLFVASGAGVLGIAIAVKFVAVFVKAKYDSFQYIQNKVQTLFDDPPMGYSNSLRSSADQFGESELVMLCFHGWLGAGVNRNVQEWADTFLEDVNKAKVFPIFLNAPFRRTTGSGDSSLKTGGSPTFEWFAYKSEANPKLKEFASLQDYMDVMKLTEKSTDQVLQVVHRITHLVQEILSVSSKPTFFVGTSQGAAISFSAAVHAVSHGTCIHGFAGGFFHHMAGLYKSVQPSSKLAAEVMVASSKMYDLDQDGKLYGRTPHMAWTPSERDLLNEFVAHVQSQPACNPLLEVVFQPRDEVIPIQLADYVNLEFGTETKIEV